MAKLTCPECEATLNPAKPVAAGKKVKCPRCESVFVVPANEDEEEFDEETTRNKSAAKKAVSGVKKAPAPKPRAESKPEPKPPSKPVPLTDEEEEEEAKGVYGFQTSAEEDAEAAETKPKITYAPDLSVKDPRGPATAQLISPSNWIIVHAAELFFGGVFLFFYGVWPFVFSDMIVDPRDPYRKVKKVLDALREAEQKKAQAQGGMMMMGTNPLGRTVEASAAKIRSGVYIVTQKQEKEIKGVKQTYDLEIPVNFNIEVTEEEYIDPMTSSELESKSVGAFALWELMTEEKQELHIWLIVCGILSAIYGMVVGYGGVMMQNLTSYNWSITCAIMVIVAGVGLGGLGIYFLTEDALAPKFVTVMCSGIFFGGWALVMLKEEKIKEAFTYKPE